MNEREEVREIEREWDRNHIFRPECISYRLKGEKYDIHALHKMCFYVLSVPFSLPYWHAPWRTHNSVGNVKKIVTSSYTTQTIKMNENDWKWMEDKRSKQTSRMFCSFFSLSFTFLDDNKDVHHFIMDFIEYYELWK